MPVAYEAATIAKWKQKRPHEDTDLLVRTMAQDDFRILVQFAFEAGRQWQSEHPTASVEFPDYHAPAARAAVTLNGKGLSQCSDAELGEAWGNSTGMPEGMACAIAEELRLRRTMRQV